MCQLIFLNRVYEIWPSPFEQIKEPWKEELNYIFNISWLNWAFLIKVCPLPVVDSVVVIVVNFSYFVFTTTTRPMSTILGTKHPWVNGIQTGWNEGLRSIPRGNNNKNSYFWRSLILWISWQCWQIEYRTLARYDYLSNCLIHGINDIQK